MRHLNKGRKLSRNGAHRKALLQNLATALFEHGQIETTKAKALELRGYVDRLITTAKQGDVSARRNVFEKIRNQAVLKNLFDTIAPGFKNRNGGFTSLVNSRFRKGDCAPMAIVSLVGAQAEQGAVSTAE